MRLSCVCLQIEEDELEAEVEQELAVEEARMEEVFFFSDHFG